MAISRGTAILIEHLIKHKQGALLMDLMNRLVITLVALMIAGSIDIVFFTASYGLLRLMCIPVRWVTLAIGWFVITVGVVATLAGPFYPSAIGLAGIMGVFSFGIGIYALEEWVARRWYLTVKRGSLAFITRSARDFYLFVRQHHNFFGWIVLLTASAHSILLLLQVNQLHFGAVWSGFLAWGIAGVLFMLGLIADRAMRRKQIFAGLRVWHIGFSLAFFTAIIIHIVAL